VGVGLQVKATDGSRRRHHDPIDKHGQPQPVGLMDINATAARLGVSVRHMRRLVHERRIPFIKWGHLIQFDPHEIEQWLEAARVPSCHSPRIRER
jgi:excisionase family DNA binding protein